MEEIQGELARGEGVAGYWPRLRDKLANWAVTNVAERLIGPNPCDFWVEKPRMNAEPLRVIVELKTAREGYGRGQLVDPIESQLWGRYMVPSDCRHGIHVVLWFKDEARYPYPTAWDAPENLLSALQDRSRSVGQEGDVLIATYVLDLTAPSRR